ncbi:uncharacterized protein LOC110989850 isoform X1 [Acanthaster planci]|uniref:Uncharacterized protein LOC110989850 isoform X1 n=1 Tax=Acanthaster planci TaxID=133434 RepID=A0A8B8A2U9_ACAPL|nr:uncharacterized protein LOC110989850 isoform X1 [Acanthaster planci]
MTSLMTFKLGCVPAFFICWFWLAHAHNDVLSSDYFSSSSSDDYGVVIEPSDVYKDIETSSEPSSSSSSDSSSAYEAMAPEDPPDLPSEPSDESSMSSSSSISATVDVAPCVTPPCVVVDEPWSVSSSSYSSSSSDVDLSEVEDISVDPGDPSYVPPHEIESSSTDNPQKLGRKVTNSESGQGQRKRGPSSIGAPLADSNSKRMPGRPPAVFRGLPQPDVGRRLGGPPSIQRLEELRDADRKYLDLYLCGQFLKGSADASAEDFAVVSFNYAGRTQPFSPCSELGSTTETVNYIYRTASGGLSALQQVVNDLPTTWQRYVSEKGSAPRVVHIFTVNMPSSSVVDDVSNLLQLRRSATYRSARFVLGYLNQPTAADLSNSAREFLNLLSDLNRARIDTVRVCGRCAKAAGYPAGGRRRKNMQYGISVVSATSTDVQCLALQEHLVPGAYFSTNTCDSFQKAIVRCFLRGIARRCREADTGTDFIGVDTDETGFLEVVNGLTQTCGVDSDCWRKEGESIRDDIALKSQMKCQMPEVAVSKMFGRCAATAVSFPFDIQIIQRPGF